MKLFNSAKSKRGFTLVEMIGVLAIIAVLAVVIAPKVFSAIRSSRINGTLVSIDTYKTAAAEFIGKYGTLPATSNNSRIDDLFIETGLIDDRFSSKIGAQSDIYANEGAGWVRGASGTWTASGGTNQRNTTRIVCGVSTTTNPATAIGRNFKLDGTNNLPSGARVLAAILESVTEAEAREMSERVDGEGLSTTSGGDDKGKVAYATPPSSGLVDVYVYMTHQ